MSGSASEDSLFADRARSFEARVGSEAASPDRVRIDRHRAADSCDERKIDPQLERFTSNVVAQYSPLLRAARRMTCSDDEARDLVQDTLERALRNWRKFDGANLYGWLYTAMKHLFLDGKRRARALTRTKEELIVNAEVVSEPEALRSVGCTDQLERALARIDDDSRQILMLRECQSLSYGTIATLLGISPSCAGVRLFRARARLQQELEALAE